MGGDANAEDRLDRIVADEPQLRQDGIALSCLDVADHGATITVEVFAADPVTARRIFQQRYGDQVEVIVVGPSEFRVEVVPWESWTTDDGRRLFVWACAAEPTVRVEESAEVVRIELRERRYQGARAGPLNTTKVPVSLRSPLGQRAVVDAATDEIRPEGRTAHLPHDDSA